MPCNRDVLNIAKRVQYNREDHVVGVVCVTYAAVALAFFDLPSSTTSSDCFRFPFISDVGIEMVRGTMTGSETAPRNVFLVSALINSDLQVEEMASFAAA